MENYELPIRLHNTVGVVSHKPVQSSESPNLATLHETGKIAEAHALASWHSDAILVNGHRSGRREASS